MKKIYIKDINEGWKGKIKCWVSNKRHIKNTLFIDLYDSTEEIQGIAIKDECSNYDEATKITRESAVEVYGYFVNNELKINSIKVLALASYNLSPSPNEKRFNVFDHKMGKQVIEHPTFYIRNKKLKTIYYIKSVFKRNLQNYMWERNFVEFESPTLTRQTLYDDTGAVWLKVEGQDVTLSRCATFHLEPAIVAYEKVFTITNSHANEKIRTNRHLVEYLHLKIEVCWTNLEELIDFAGELYYKVAKKTYEMCEKEFLELIDKKTIEEKIEKLNPINHKMITYDEAVKILRSNNFDFEYGKSLTTKQEKFLTEYYNDNFLWVKYIPYTVEGFMFKRNKNNTQLTQTCDLIAPNGYGEILGCAEKMTDYNEIIESMKQKDKFKDYNRYEDYALLHKYGLPEHGGIGMGIERALRYLINVDHVKYTKPFAVVKGSQINH